MWERYKDIIEHIDVGSGALERAASWISDWKSPLIVADLNTRRVAGDALCSILDAKGVIYDTLTYPDELLVGDETAIGALCAAYRPENDLIVAVGSGTLGDLCKFVGCRVGRPCAVVGTAPSMDGYASAGAAMTLGGMKVTPRTQCPCAIFCDTDILKDAPMPMIAAGMGDVLGKFNALADWKLSNLLTGEPIPQNIAALVSDAASRCVENAQGALRREPEAIRLITEALILSGLAMSLYGDSRPASGCEHHLSHYWEMRFIAEKKTPVLHGLKVGVATIAALKLWKSLPDRPSPPTRRNRARVLDAVRRAYGSAAPALIKTENPDLPFELILENWEKIKQIAESAPQPGFIAALLGGMGAPVTPSEIGVDDTMLRDSILLARERKKTYTLLQLLGDLGLLESRDLFDIVARGGV